MEETFQSFFGCLRKKADKMFHKAVIGFLRGPEIDVFRKILAHFFLRCAVLGYTPAASDTVPIHSIDKIPDDHIALLLKTGYGGIKPFLPFDLLPAAAVGIAAEQAQIL